MQNLNTYTYQDFFFFFPDDLDEERAGDDDDGLWCTVPLFAKNISPANNPRPIAARTINGCNAPDASILSLYVIKSIRTPNASRTISKPKTAFALV